MFAIGDKEWPGISKLIEETSEVGQVCGKLIGTGGKVSHWDGTNLKERLEEEIADALAAIEFVMTYCKLDIQKIVIRSAEKAERFEKWHAAAEHNHGVLDE